MILSPKDLIDETEVKEEVNLLDIARKQLIPQNVDIQKPNSLFDINGVDFFTSKSLSMVQADAKSGKTSVVAWAISIMILKGVKILWIDTEQGEYYGSRTQSWVLRMSGLIETEYLEYYDLSIFPPLQRIEITEALISNGSYHFVVIDGIRDFVSDINSTDEATNISTSLMKWARVFDCHILSIIHENKGESKSARGHLGREIENKCETALRVETNEDKQIIVTAIRYRGQPIEPFALERDEHGIPSYIDDWKPGESGRKAITPHNFDTLVHFDIVGKVFSKKEYLTHKECRDNIRHFFDLHGVRFGDPKARDFLTHYLQRDLIIEDPIVKGWAKLKSALEVL